MVNRSRFKEPYKRARILAGLWEEVNLQKKKTNVILYPFNIYAYLKNPHGQAWRK